MSTGSAADGGAARGGGSSAAGGPARPARRVVISSVTGKPIVWDEPTGSAQAGSGREAPKVLPDRVAEDAPEPGADESNDARLSGDVPPHWGRGG